MKLWKLSQTVMNGYDTYDSCVVAAETETLATAIHPSAYASNMPRDAWRYDDWPADPGSIKVEYLGEAKPGTEPGVICASFNAG